MKSKFKFVIFGLLSISALNVFAELSTQEIVNKNDATRKVQDMVMNASLFTKGKGSEDKEKKFKYWQKMMNEKEARFYRLTRFSHPASIKNEGILFLEKSAKTRDIFLYLPKFKKTRRIENNAQSGSFMGTVFSYSDISVPAIDEMKFSLERTEKCPADTKYSGDCYVLKSVGKDRRVTDRIGCDYQTLWIRKDNFLSLRSDCFEKDGKAKKKILFGDYENVDSKKNLWVAKKIEGFDLKSGAYSSFIIDNLDVNKGINASVFSMDNLENP